MRPRCAIARLLAIPAAAVLLVTAGATTGPTTIPAADPSIVRWFDQLADADPSVRDDARQSLMGLTCDADLDRLLAAVRAARPLRPAQAAALHDIVCHVFLVADDPYVAVGDPPNRAPPHYVMGLRWANGMDDSPRLGVPVVERWPGFPARQMLRDGDMILGVYVDRDAPLQRPPNVITHTPGVIIGAIRDAPTALRDVDLAVLRDGREIRVPMHMVPQPVEASSTMEVADAFLAARLQRAETYWQDHFAPVVDPAADGPPEEAASLDP
jgi:hypothetical protein